jgi:spore germination protein KC
MRRAAAIVALIFMLASLAGCWDYKEYEDMALIFAIGVDTAPRQDDISLTVEYLVSAGGERGGQKRAAPGPQGVAYTAVSPTLETAVDKMQEGVARQLFFPYTRIIIISEEAAKKKMGEIIKFLYHYPQIHDYAYVFVTPGKAGDVLSTRNQYDDKSASQAIFDLTRELTINAFSVRLGTLKQTLLTGGREAALPGLIATAVSNGAEAGKSSAPVRLDTGSIQMVAKTDGLIAMSGMAAFNRDKFAGWLNEAESRGWGWITNKRVKGYKFVFQVPGSDQKLTFHLLGSNSKVRTHLDGGRITVDVNINAKAAFEDYIPTSAEFAGPETVARLEKYMEECIRGDVEASINKAQQELKTDLFGIGFTFFRQHHRQWQGGIDKQWVRLFPDIPLKVTIKTKVINTGIRIK